MVTISIIAAMSQNRVIGNMGKIPWHIREDLVKFRDLTLNHTVIMGRKAFDSMIDYYKNVNKPLPNRNHIIITNNHEYKIDLPNCFVTYSLPDALDLAKTMEQQEIFISGGGQIYTQSLKFAEKLYLTVIKGNFPGDTYFPDYSEFKIIKKEEKSDVKYQYDFLELVKR